MGLKRRVKIGDYVQYISNEKIVCDKEGKPLRVVKFVTRSGIKSILYEDGEFDFLDMVKPALPLLVELL